MTGITATDDGFVVDAEILGAGFGIDPAAIPAMLRSGDITSRSETGVDKDAGRFRLTFFHGAKGLRLTVDSHGRLLAQSSFAVPARGSAAQ